MLGPRYRRSKGTFKVPGLFAEYAWVIGNDVSYILRSYLPAKNTFINIEQLTVYLEFGSVELAVIKIS